VNASRCKAVSSCYNDCIYKSSRYVAWSSEYNYSFSFFDKKTTELDANGCRLDAFSAAFFGNGIKCRGPVMDGTAYSGRYAVQVYIRSE